MISYTHHTFPHSFIAKSSKMSKKSKKKHCSYQTTTVVDHTHLTFGCHQAFIASLALIRSLQASYSLTSPTSSSQIENEVKGGACNIVTSGPGAGVMNGGVGPVNFLLVGLGGGAFPMFLNKHIPSVSLCM